MSAQHTPGPWKQFRPNDRMVCAGDRGQFCIAETFGALGRDPAANARLIAAAPDLYSALEQIAHVNEYNTSDMGWVVGLAKTAIAKASGEDHDA